MSTNLIDTAKGLVTPEMLQKVASATGEAPEGTHRALQGALPTIFAALAHRSSTPEGASAVFAAVTRSAIPSAVGKLTEAETPEAGPGLMRSIFGERGASVTEALARSSGIKGSSAVRVLEFATPLVAGVIGKEAVSRKMNPGELSQMLSAHRQAIADDPNTPAGLSDALGSRATETQSAAAHGPEPRVASATERPSRFHEAEQRAREFEQKAGRGARDVGQRVEREARELEHRAAMAVQRPPWKVAIGVIALGLAIWGIFMGTHHRVHPTGVTAPQPTAPTLSTLPTLQAPAAPPAPEAPAPAAPAPETPAPAAPGPGVTLPGGGTLDVAPNSPEAQFAHALADDSVVLPRAFSFNQLAFPSGSSALGPDASKTLDALAASLTAHPSAHVRVEGYAGKGGSPTARRALAESRARTVKATLVSRGVAPDRIRTTGRGVNAAGAKRTEIVLVSR